MSKEDLIIKMTKTFKKHARKLYINGEVPTHEVDAVAFARTMEEYVHETKEPKIYNVGEKR